MRAVARGGKGNLVTSTSTKTFELIFNQMFQYKAFNAIGKIANNGIIQ